MVVAVSFRGREPERWSMADVSGAPSPASPDRFVSAPQVALTAPQSFCPVRQAAFADSEPSQPNLSLTTAPQSFDLVERVHVATFQRSENHRPSMNEFVEWLSVDQANPAPDDPQRAPRMSWPSPGPVLSTPLPARIWVRERKVLAATEARPCSTPPVGSVEQRPRLFRNIFQPLHDFRRARVMPA